VLSIVQLIGYAGMTLVLLTLILTRKHYLKSQIVSIFGGILLAANAYCNGPDSYPFLILNSVWSVISIYNLLKTRREKSVKVTS